MGSRSGELVISDFSNGKLHRVDITDPANMTTEVLVNATGTTPNGVVIDEANNRAIVVNWGGNAPILDVDLATGEFSIALNTGLGNLDGVDMDGAVNFTSARGPRPASPGTAMTSPHRRPWSKRRIRTVQSC